MEDILRISFDLHLHVDITKLYLSILSEEDKSISSNHFVKDKLLRLWKLNADGLYLIPMEKHINLGKQDISITHQFY